MTGEFTFYTLFIMLTISMGVVFQFLLGQIRNIKSDAKKMQETIRNIQNQVQKIRNSPRSPSRVTRRQRPGSHKRSSTLSGDLDLEYKGTRAQTKAVFYIDNEN